MSGWDDEYNLHFPNHILHFRVKMLMREDVKAVRVVTLEALAQIFRNRLAGVIIAVPEVMAVTAS